MTFLFEKAWIHRSHEYNATITDEKKIEEERNKVKKVFDDFFPHGTLADANERGKHYRFINFIVGAIYHRIAEHIRKQTIEEMEAKIKNMDIQVGSPCKPVANMVKTGIIKHLQRHHE